MCVVETFVSNNSVGIVAGPSNLKTAAPILISDVYITLSDASNN